VASGGGAGAFGRGLAGRWREAGVDGTVGSRDPAGARGGAAVLGVSGATNAEAVRDVDLAVLAVQSSSAIDTARELAPILGATPVLCVASDLRFEHGAVFPARSEGSIAEDVAELVAGPVLSPLPRPPAAPPPPPPPLHPDGLVFARH